MWEIGKPVSSKMAKRRDSMFLQYLKQYSQETTLHGFRYVVESRSVIVSVLWIGCIAGSFIFAGFEVAANLKETSEQPIATSINSIPVEEIPFPAVTIKRRNIQGTNSQLRFVQEVLDRIELDCTHSGKFILLDNDECLNRTSQVREDLQPFLEQLLAKQYYIAKEFVMQHKNTDDWHSHDFVCLWFYTAGEEFDWGGLAWGFAKAYDDSTNQTALEVALISNMARMFRTPIKANLIALKQFINESLPGEPGWYQIRKCENDSEIFQDDFSEEAVAATLAMYIMTGLKDVDHDLTWGSLMLQDGTLTPLVLSTQEQINFTLNLLNLILQLEGNQTGLASGHIDVNVYADLVLNTFANYTYLETNCLGTSSQTCAAECCNIIEENNDQRLLMLRIMKYWLPPISRLIYEKQELIELDTFARSFGFFLKTKEKPSINKHAVIYSCKYGYQEMSHECNLFSKLYTMGGIGYTFNNDKFWNIYKKTEMNQKFYHEMYEKEESQEDNLPRLTVDNGQPFSLTLYVNPSITPYLTVHSPMAVPDIVHEALELEAGKTYTISVTPAETISDQSVLDFSFEKRKCRSKDDSEDLMIYKHYTQSACIFECHLKYASETCQCIPWDYPVYDESLPLCSNKDLEDTKLIFEDIQFDKCFEDALEVNKSVANCDCPQECSELQYTYTTMVQDTISYKICIVSRIDDPTFTSDPFGENIGIDAFLENEFFSMDTLHNGWASAGSMNRDERCHKMLKEDLAVVKVFVAPTNINQVVRTKRVSFSSQLANLGGIIGLFSGMSLLSLVEFAHWLFIMAGSSCRGCWTRRREVARNVMYPIV